MEDQGHLIKRAETLGTKVKEMIEAILLRGRGYVDTRAVWGILSLDKKYNQTQINKACGYALECDQLGYQAVMRFINVMPQEKNLIEKSVQNKFTRDPKEYGFDGLLN
jgi:hypothetical protein